MDDENQDQLLNEYDFEMAVNSSNPENGSDNQVRKSQFIDVCFHNETLQFPGVFSSKG